MAELTSPISRFRFPRKLALTGVLCAVALLSNTVARSQQLDRSTSGQNSSANFAAKSALPATSELLHDVRSSTPTNATRAGNSKSDARVVMMEVTAYCPCKKCCGPNARGITASGRHVSYDNAEFVAADPSFEFGTRLVIPGYAGNRAVEVIDRGSAIRGQKIDVYFSSHERAMEWGRKQIPVVVLP